MATRSLPSQLQSADNSETCMSCERSTRVRLSIRSFIIDAARHRAMTRISSRLRMFQILENKIIVNRL